MTQLSDPCWIVLKSDGQMFEGDGSPREHLGDPGDLLIVGGEHAIVLAPSPEAEIHWLTTIDKYESTGVVILNIAGPGIRSPKTVRTWIFDDSIVVTDGPVENAYVALKRIATSRRRDK